MKQLIFDWNIFAKIVDFSRRGLIRAYRQLPRDSVIMEKEIGRGSGGIVFKGSWRDKEVALKVCGVSGVFLSTAEEFRFESTVMSILSHPNVMTCFGANEDVEDPFIAMPFKAEGNLRDFWSKFKLTLSEKMNIAIQISKGIQYLHSCGMIHRDLKPMNILVGSEMDVCLIDFGVSKFDTRKKAQMTLNVGTPFWSAPEMFAGNDGFYTSAVDVFSFAIILWEILEEKNPYEDCEINLFDIPQRIIGGLRPTISDRIPQPLVKLLEQCWNGSFKKRPTFKQITRRLVKYQSSNNL